jgi:hypothetical protein
MITGSFGRFVCDTIDERDSLLDSVFIIEKEGIEVYVKTSPPVTYKYVNRAWVVTGGNLVVSSTEPVDKFDGLTWIQPT